jgi:hypothetical protein
MVQLVNAFQPGEQCLVLADASSDDARGLSAGWDSVQPYVPFVGERLAWHDSDSARMKKRV